MAKKIIKAQMKQRQDTKANWAAANPVLLDGELGMVSDDRNLYKVGDGRTAWNDLPFRGFDGTLAQELGTSANAAISQKAVTEKLTELSEEVGQVAGQISELHIPFLGVAWETIYHPILRGQVIVSMDNTNGIYLVYDTGKEAEFVGKGQLPYTMQERAIGFQCISNDAGELVVQGVFSRQIEELETEIEEKASDLADRIANLTIAKEIAFESKAWHGVNLDTPLRAGTSISVTANVEIAGIYLLKVSGGEAIWVSKEQFPYTLTEDITAFQTIVDAQGVLTARGAIDARIAPIATEVQELKQGSFNELYEQGSLSESGKDEPHDNLLRTTFIPCKKGDVVNSRAYNIAEYDGHYGCLGVKPVPNGGYYGATDYVIESESCAFVRVVILIDHISPISINGIDANFLVNKGQWQRLQDADKEFTTLVESFSIPFISAAWEVIYHPLYKGQTIVSMANTIGITLVREGKSGIDLSASQLPYTLEDDAYGFYCFTADAGELVVQGSIDKKISDALKYYQPSSGDVSALNDNPYIAMPIPQLAFVNIVATNLPTTKVDDIHAVLEFDDRNGNHFKKNIIINAQGSSSMGMAKKNFSVDIMDEAYDDSHKIKFGKWVAQDGFHLKSYMWDGLRVKAMAAYDIYESIILHNRPTRSNRVWKRAQLPTDIPQTGNDLNGTYLQLDSGAKGHPSGFPVIVNFNGEFYGIYCWQLKKHRDNYHQKKDNAGHIHLDGVISDDLLWKVNGNIDWDKWAGKKAESEAIQSFEGTEIRNPKKLILVDGSEYDGDNNRGELISTASANYNPSNKDMVRTAEVRANIESLSRRVYALTQMSKGAAKKAEIAKVFDVDSIIDYIIFSQLLYNDDGYRKNWQWTTHDGVKWAVNAYDLDGVWGWSSWSNVNPSQYWLYTSTPPIGLIVENYLDEIKARYADLRNSKVVSVDRMMQPLVNYVQVIGTDYYDQEYEKWTEGVRDNLWRFEVWMEESIRLTDILMDYNKAA